MSQQLNLAICGGGVGGLCAAIACLNAGHQVQVYEKAKAFLRIGADVNLTPNAVKCLDGLGVGDIIRETAARPTRRLSRTWDTGEITSNIVMGNEAEERYGAPQLTIHRGDLLKALEQQLPSDIIHLDHGVESITHSDAGSDIQFEGSRSTSADLVVGADGIHSVVRRSLFGADQPEFTGLVSYRAVIPRSAVDVPNLDAFTKWWGPTPDMQLVVFPLTRGEEVFIFATTPQEGWYDESWTMPGDVDELREVYADFHPEVQQLLGAVTAVTKSALYVREPMPTWHLGRATVIGDAAHPMVPFMAQGACMAIEDGVVLSRCLSEVGSADIAKALARFERARLERTANVQRGSRANDWLKQGGNADWVYGYDAWNVTLN